MTGSVSDPLEGIVAKRKDSRYESGERVSSDDRFLILHSADEATVAPITLLLNWKPHAR